MKIYIPIALVLTPFISLNTKSCDTLAGFSPFSFASFSVNIFRLIWEVCGVCDKLRGGSRRPWGLKPCSRHVRKGKREPAGNDNGGSCKPSWPIKMTVPPRSAEIQWRNSVNSQKTWSSTSEYLSGKLFQSRLLQFTLVKTISNTGCCSHRRFTHLWHIWHPRSRPSGEISQLQQPAFEKFNQPR